MFRTMKASVSCFLALLSLTTVVNARHTASLPDNSSEQETTTQADWSARVQEGASEGEEGAVFANAIRQVVQESLRLQEQRVARASLQMEQQLQERDRALRALLDERMQRVEQRLADAPPQGQQLGDRLHRLEAAVGRILEHLRLDAPEPHASPSTSARPQAPSGGDPGATAAAAAATGEERQRPQAEEDKTTDTYKNMVLPEIEICKEKLQATDDDVNALLNLKIKQFSQKTKCLTACVLERLGAMKDGRWTAVPADYRLQVYKKAFRGDTTREDKANSVIDFCHVEADKKFEGRRGAGCDAAFDAIECLSRLTH